MIPMSILEKLKSLFGIATSSTFFLIAIIVSILFFCFTLFNILSKKMDNHKIFIFIWGIIAVGIVIMYHNFIIGLGDSFIENIFMAIYFPSLAVFSVMVLLSNLVLFYSVFKKNLMLFFKIVWSVSAILINLLFVFILDIVVKDSVDIYSKAEVYGNQKLLVLLEVSMAIFALNLGMYLIITLIKKLIGEKPSKKVVLNPDMSLNMNVENINKESNNNVITNTNVINDVNVLSQANVNENRNQQMVNVNNNINNSIERNINNVNNFNNSINNNNTNLANNTNNINNTNKFNSYVNSLENVQVNNNQVSILDSNLNFNNNNNNNNKS